LKNLARVGDDSDTRAALLPMPCAAANAAQRQIGFKIVVVGMSVRLCLI